MVLLLKNSQDIHNLGFFGKIDGFFPKIPWNFFKSLNVEIFF